MERLCQSIKLQHCHETDRKKIVCVASPKPSELKKMSSFQFNQFRLSQFEYYLSTLKGENESIFIVVKSLKELKEGQT